MRTPICSGECAAAVATSAPPRSSSFAAPLDSNVLAGPVFWPMEKSAEVLRFYRDWVAGAPDELMTIVVHRKAPPLPFVPVELHGERVDDHLLGGRPREG